LAEGGNKTDDTNSTRRPLSTSAANTTPDCQGSRQGFEKGTDPSKYAGLVRRINILVRAVCGALSGNIARHVNVRAARSDPAARPLRFSAFKRCEILERPILVQRSTSRSRETN
jgi:hypothetical protein